MTLFIVIPQQLSNQLGVEAQMKRTNSSLGFSQWPFAKYIHYGTAYNPL